MSFNPELRTSLLSREPGQFKSAYSTKLNVEQSFPTDSEHTRQEFKDECDINNIMRQYQHTGEIFHINEAAPQYMDCSAEDFRDAMDYVAGAFSMFEELPSAIRIQFDNDPAAFLDFCSQEKNRPEMAAMGLLSQEAMDALNTPAPTPPLAPTAPIAPPAPIPEPTPKPA